jgi:hypothetical protein
MSRYFGIEIPVKRQCASNIRFGLEAHVYIIVLHEEFYIILDSSRLFQPVFLGTFDCLCDDLYCPAVNCSAMGVKR